ncbi:MAG: hypothetical protein PHO37_10260 [Kiritimatiellae bacterium]|nr:hypothetical protein [Kiritimatiellia bacterium]
MERNASRKLPGTRQPSDYQVEAVGRLAVTAPAKRKSYASRTETLDNWPQKHHPAVTARGYSAAQVQETRQPSDLQAASGQGRASRAIIRSKL